MGKVKTTVPSVPSGIDPALSQFLSAVKTQIETREGMSRSKDEAFLTIRDGKRFMDQSIETLKREIPRAAEKQSPKLDLTSIETNLTRLDRDVKSIKSSRIFNQPMKENYLTDTFIFVGEQRPSDEGWRPVPGVGITSVGLFGIAEEGGETKGRFLLSSYNVPGLGGSMFEPFLGDSISQGELRVGDSIAYDEGQDTLIGDTYLWYRADRGMEMKFSRNGINSKILMNENGIFGYGSGGDEDMKFGFTLVDIPSIDYPGGTIPAGTAFFKGHIWASEIRGTDGLTVRPDLYSNRKIELNEQGLWGTDENGNPVFVFTLQNVGGFSAGTAAFTGDLILGNYSGGSGIWYNSSTGVMDFKGIDISMSNINDLPSSIRNTPVTGLNLTSTRVGFYDASKPSGQRWQSYIDNEGGGLFRGHVACVNESSAYYSVLGDFVAIYGQWDSGVGVGGVGKWGVIGASVKDGGAGVWASGSNGSWGLYVENGNSQFNRRVFFGNPIRPTRNGVYDCGEPSYKWYNVHADRINVTGNAVRIGSASKHFHLRVRDYNTNDDWMSLDAYIEPIYY